jgi:putative salt-induced outer membrane protein YdiY
MNRRFGIAATIAVLTLPKFAAGQAQPPPPPPKLEGTAELAFVGTTGNASTNTLSAAGEVIGRPNQWVIITKAAAIRNEADDVLTADSLLFGFRGERIINTRLSAFGEYAYFQDEFAGVDHRNGVTGGLAFKVFEDAIHSLVADADLGYLNESRLTGDDVSSATYGGGARYQWKISPTATLDEEVRLTGTFDIAEDWRLGQRVSVTARLTEILSLKVSNAIRYVRTPPIGFKTTDTTTSVALVAKFRRQ